MSAAQIRFTILALYKKMYVVRRLRLGEEKRKRRKKESKKEEYRNHRARI